jgi:hypothetical protein
MPIQRPRFRVLSACLVYPNEWLHLTRNYLCDQEISVELKDDGTCTFDPNVCEPCMQEMENSKYFFENKKIFVRQLDVEEEIQTVEIKEKDDDDTKMVTCKFCKTIEVFFETDVEFSEQL